MGKASWMAFLHILFYLDCYTPSISIGVVRALQSGKSKRETSIQEITLLSEDFVASNKQRLRLL